MKHRILAAVLCCLLVVGCALPVFAESSAPYVDNITTVTSDGGCRVTLQVDIHLDTIVDGLTFPLPADAKDVKLNGSSVRASRSGGVLQVDLSGVVGSYIGDYTLRFDYSIDEVVTYADKKLTLELPLLCGFAYPVNSMEFSVNMPGEVDTRPYFTGSYRQSTMESIMTISTKGSLISGTVNAPLDELETVTMTMEVSTEMFPTVSTFQREGNPEIVPMLIIGAVALLYWLLTMRAFPFLRTRRATPPEGVSAGELGCRLTFTGADLTMMVFNWAQLGYLLIHVDENHRVILHKRMEMGNERSLFEVKAFKSLFGNKRMVDGTGYQYARLYRSLSRQIPGERAMSTASSGNRKVFRLLNCAIHAIAGVCLAMNMTGQEFLQVVLAILLGAFGAVSAWKIQEGMLHIHLRTRQPLLLAGILGVLWLLVSIWAGVFLIGLLTLLVQIIAGLANAYGGRRSDMGRQNAYAILGLRSFLKTISKEEIHKLSKPDPEYFHNMLPYALALGVELPFAKRFGKRKLPPCPYLIYGRKTGHQSAESLARQMREAAQILDARHRRMEWEKFAVVRIR